mmetsp:Transcript_14907/g.26631  ORF Transcript_14907/g.26631 Transcript_14907/m.26631 type:complete len:200 (-) Transcript_14907:38-637(-)
MSSRFGNSEKNVFFMWSAGFCAGAVGFFLANPFFLAKVRLQATAGQPNQPYRSMWHCLAQTYQREGLTGLYRGSSALVIRGALLSAGAQVGYDGTKTKLKGVIEEGPMLHVVASVTSAFLASVMSAPCDLILTKYQAGPILGIKYASVFDCARIVVRDEGPMALYRGFTPLFFRLAPLWMLNMPMYEATRRLMGLSYLD